jgi:hypothetical protein
VTSIPGRHIQAGDRVSFGGGLNVACEFLAEGWVHSHIDQVDIEGGGVGAARRVIRVSIDEHWERGS